MQRTTIIAEAGINHNGDLDIAKRLIRLAAVAGCDAVKFQKRNPDVCVPEHQKNILKKTPWGEMTYLEYKHRMEFNEEQYKAISECAKHHEIAWSASPWDLGSLDFLIKFDVPWIKIPSAMLTNEELLAKSAYWCCNQGKKLILSTGMSTEQEIDEAYKVIADVSSGFDWIYDNLVLMHCNSTYPAPLDELNLQAIRTLKKKYACEVGYCVIPSTRVLTTDLQWVEAGNISVGDKLIAFDEELTLHTRMKEAIVTNNNLRKLPCYRIITDRGDITVSDRHKFVVSIYIPRKHTTGGVWRSVWMEAKDIQPGMKIRHFVEPWSMDTSYDAGWLSGIFDGAGWVSGRKLAMAQNPGSVLDRAEQILSNKGYTFSARRQNKDGVCVAIEIGGRRNALRLLGSLRPIRLLPKADKIWNGVRAYSTDSRAEVISIESVGTKETSAITTSTGTLITEGFFSHNSGHEFRLGTSVAAIYMGATYIERHITLDRSMWGTDQLSSVEPQGLLKLVSGIRELELAHGDGVIKVTESQIPVREKLRG